MTFIENEDSDILCNCRTHTGEKEEQMLFIYSLALLLSGITKAKDWGNDKEIVILFKTSVLQFLS